MFIRRPAEKASCKIQARECHGSFTIGSKKANIFSTASGVSLVGGESMKVLLDLVYSWFSPLRDSWDSTLVCRRPIDRNALW